MDTRCTMLWVLSTFIVGISMTGALVRNINEKHYSLIESFKDATANPCTDFYQYVCGNWKTTHTEEEHMVAFETLFYEINDDFENILRIRKQDLSKQHRFVRQTLAYHKSCKSVKKYSPVNFLRKLEKEEGIKWPDFSSGARRFFKKLKKQHQADQTPNNVNRYWLKMWATLRKYGMNGIFVSEDVLPKQNDTRKFIVQVSRPSLGEEFTTLEDIFESVEDEEEKTDLEETLEEYTEFEAKLIELYHIENKIDYEELKLSEITIPELKPYLEIVMNTTDIDVDMQIALHYRPYIAALFRLLSHYDDLFICRYLKIRFIFSLTMGTAGDFTDKGCIMTVRKNMPMAMSWMHKQQHAELFSESNNLKGMFESLRAHFIQTLTANSNDFDRDVVDRLNTKVMHMQFKFGTLPSNATVTTMDAFYHDLTLNDSDFYGNHLKVLRFSTSQQHARLQLTVEQDALNTYMLEDTEEDQMSTPYYLPRHNMVILPLTWLHPPVYHPQFHDVFKYSMMGFLLGHEITHALDEGDLDYDERGNQREGFSKLLKSNKLFGGHMDCLEGKNPSVLDEKIADVSGLRWAYETYFGNATQAERQLNWSKMSQQQLFFHNFGIFFCGDRTKDEKYEETIHGSFRSRLHEAVYHFDEFGRAFNCHAGAAMNPRKKCQLWR